MKRELKTPKEGYYLNRATGEFIRHDQLDMALYPEKKYVKVPAAAIFLGAPFLSFAYVIFLPLTGLIGMAVFLGLEIKKAMLMLAHIAIK